jgi:hypothetical protein
VSQETLDLIQSGGTLVFALLALGALISGRVQPKHVVDDKDRTIAYERSQKEQAFEKAKATQASFDRLADAVEARNLLDQERVRAKRTE